MRVRTTVLAALAAMLTAAGCGSDNDGNASNTTTSRENTTMDQAQAHQGIETHLTDLLRTLPTEVSLSRQDPKYPRTMLGSGNTVPCNDSAPEGTGPVNLGVSYWVIGIPESDVHEYLNKITDTWKQQGWKVTLDTDGDTTYGRTVAPDDYAFTVADHNQGILTIASSSPCFPREGVDNQPMPRDIPHPA